MKVSKDITSWIISKRILFNYSYIKVGRLQLSASEYEVVRNTRITNQLVTDYSTRMTIKYTGNVFKGLYKNSTYFDTKILHSNSHNNNYISENRAKSTPIK